MRSEKDIILCALLPASELSPTLHDERCPFLFPTKKVVFLSPPLFFLVFYVRKIVEHFIFLSPSPLGYRWPDGLGFVLAARVSPAFQSSL